MKMKVTAVALIVGVALVLAVALRTANRSEAAAGKCYSHAKGPSEPTVCS
jgi:hypothetical protein